MKTSLALFQVNNPYTYMEYKQLVLGLAEKHQTTGEATEERIVATKINTQRIKRIEKQIVISIELKGELEKIKSNWKWILLTEAWCGDGAQNLPILSKIAEQSSKIDLTIILRDENSEIMDLYLTNGSRSIPKLICINTDTDEKIGSWGPRTQIAADVIKEYKILNPNSSHDDLMKFLHLWYANDKGESLQKEFVDLIKKWNN